MTITSSGPGFVELELDLIPALRREIQASIPTFDMLPLVFKNASEVPDAQGVYFLYFRPRLDGSDIPAYIGKTDSKSGLRDRLSRHANKIRGRRNISNQDVFFRAFRLFVFTVLDIESDLIESFGGVQKIDWNNSGFGSNDPGKERDTTKYKEEHFDTRFPIDLDGHFFDMPNGPMTVADAMQHLKDQLPYLLRFERPNSSSRKSFHEDFLNSSVSFPVGSSVFDYIAICINSLPKGWHATALPSHIIVYKDDSRKFPSGQLIARS